MSDTTTFCPFSGDQHRYFIFKTFESFEPIVGETTMNNKQVYEKVEYGVLGCNCGSVLKQEVIDGNES